jgi:hypothetical protein
MSAIPTTAQLEASEEYAHEKLCTYLPSRFNNNLTTWDSTMKACRITKAGCDFTVNNGPFSRKIYTANGTEFDVAEKEQNKMYLDFWKDNKWTPDMYVYKAVTGSKGKPVCARANHLLYRWCEFPNTRQGKDGYGSEGPGYTDVPPFKYRVLANGKETCIIGPDYCKNRGISYTDGGEIGKEDCYTSGVQQAFGFIFSDALAAYINRGT